ncbi:MAG: hypothetical protein R8J84_05205 [Mariprofundales bacterium]
MVRGGYAWVCHVSSLRGWLWLTSVFLFVTVSYAGEQVTIQVDNLPMSEAESLVKSALSKQGRVAALASQRLLVVQDDASHIKAARKLLRQFDRPADQFRVTLRVEERDALQDARLQGAVRLPGAWLQLQGGAAEYQTTSDQRWSLLLMANREGTITVGEVQPYRSQTRQWLAGYGLLERDSINLMTLSSGFVIRLQSLGGDRVQVKITPWLAHSQPGMAANAKPELLLDLGTGGSVVSPPSAINAPLRLNASPHLAAPKPVRIARAMTELVLTTGEEVEIVASGGEASLLSQTLLGRHSQVGERALLLHLRIDRM